MIYDSTAALDDDVTSYNAFPQGTPNYGTYMRAVNDDEVIVELFEMYLDFNFEHFWFRIGKQQIAWGDTPGARIMDAINPLELYWHGTLEPEEFENIRVPQWAIRGMYQFDPTPTFIYIDYIEAFLNPGDISPNVGSMSGSHVPGSPFYSGRGTGDPDPDFDRRGDVEWGVRVGFTMGQLSGTLNYMSLYTDDPNTVSSPLLIPGNEYPREDNFGMTLNYSFNYPISGVLSYEGRYIPDKEYFFVSLFWPAPPPPPPPPIPVFNKTEHDFWMHSIAFSNQMRIFPSLRSGTKFFLQHIRMEVIDGEAENVTNWIGRPTMNMWIFMPSQTWLQDRLTTKVQTIYQRRGQYKIQPAISWKPNERWVFDIQATWQGGSYNAPAVPPSWWDEVYARITYEF